MALLSEALDYIEKSWARPSLSDVVDYAIIALFRVHGDHRRRPCCDRQHQSSERRVRWQPERRAHPDAAVARRQVRVRLRRLERQPGPERDRGVALQRATPVGAQSCNGVPDPFFTGGFAGQAAPKKLATAPPAA